MKLRLLLPAVFASALSVTAQQINNLDDIAFEVKKIDSNKAIKFYRSSLQVPDTGGTRKFYYYEYIADSLTGNLIKAVIKDDRYGVARTYYFVNERLIKLYEKKIDQNGRATSYTSFFRDPTYSITNTGQSEMYDSEGNLHIDNSEILAKKIVNPSYVQ